MQRHGSDSHICFCVWPSKSYLCWSYKRLSQMFFSAGRLRRLRDFCWMYCYPPPDPPHQKHSSSTRGDDLFPQKRAEVCEKVRLLKLQSSSGRPANAQSHQRNYPTTDAKERKNKKLPIDKIIERTWWRDPKGERITNISPKPRKTSW